MAKFILVDSNIAGGGGHYLEYAEQILEVARQRGFDCHLAANKAFEGGGDNGGDYTSHSIFSHDMWGRNLSRRRRIPNQFTIEDRRYLRDYYSIGGLLWNASKALSATRHYSQQTTLPSAMARRLHQVHVARTRVEASQATALDDLTEVAESEAQGRALRYRSFRKALREAARGPVVTTPESPLLASMLRQSRASDGYGAAIGRLLDHLDVGVDDHVFVPTLSLAEGRSIRDLLRRDERARQPHWSLLFRRDVYDGYSADWPNQDWAAHEARNLFASLLPLTEAVRLSFFTDTDALTAQYNRLGSVSFRTTAIPVRTTERAAVAPADEPPKVLVLCGTGSLACLLTFIRLIESLTPQDLEKVHFLLPANFVASTGGSDHRQGSGASARARLGQFGDVITIADPAWNSKELLARADACIVLGPGAPLSTPNFAEWAGELHKMPVVVPSKSDLAQTLKRRLGAQVFKYSPGGDAVGSIVQALRCLLAEPLSAKAAEDRLIIGYLGDARAEKGFHLLPELVDALSQGGDSGAGFLLKTQVYHPDPASDIRMLRAMERIRQMPLDRVSKHEGALNSADYQQIIARSDVVFNVYARHNYVNRSSGIFVEALASRKPVLTMAGTWMSALMAEWSQSYHDRALLTSSALSKRTFAVVGDWNFLGDPDFALNRANEALNLKPGVSAWSSEAVPERANHVRIEISTGSAHSDAPLCLIVAWQDHKQLTMWELERQLNRTAPGVISSVFAVPAEAHFLWMGLSLGGYLKACPVNWVRVSWHATSGPVAEMPGGIAVADGNDAKLVQNSVAAVRAIRRSYAAYADSCSWVFDQWCKDQNAVSLFDDLMATPPAPAQTIRRFVGREW